MTTLKPKSFIGDEKTSIIDNQLAQRRFDRFKVQSPSFPGKQKIINDLLYPQTQPDNIVYSKTAIVKLLNGVLGTTDGQGNLIATGLRIYFACYVPGTNHVPPNQDNCLTILFATTILNPTPPPATDQLDNGDYYVMTADGTDIAQVDYTFAHTWVQGYNNTIRQKLNDDDMGPDKETRSLWYDITTVKETRDAIIAPRNSQKNFITAFFGEYEPVETIKIPSGKSIHVDKQLTIFFGTGKGPKLPRYITESLELEKLTRTRFLEMLTDPENYDTGVPCPPADGCSGSSLYP